MRFVCFSDTHGHHEDIDIPNGDVLLFAGDFSTYDHPMELREFNLFLGELPHTYKIVVAGNHDGIFEREYWTAKRMLTNALYLQDSLIEFKGINIYGTPWSPKFMNWAFNLSRDELKCKWNLIPSDIDILITHCAPYGIGDVTHTKESKGCDHLYNRVKDIQPKYHVFGHMHDGYGTYNIGNTIAMNVSIVDNQLHVKNKCIVFDC